MNRGFGRFKGSILKSGNPVEYKYRKDGGAMYSINSGNHYFAGPLHICSLSIIMISIIALLLLISPAFAKADFNQSTSSGDEQNSTQIAYLNGFDEGYKLGGMFIIAMLGNISIAHEYNILVQQHNDFLNETLDEEDAESNWLAKVPITPRAPSKPRDPTDL